MAATLSVAALNGILSAISTMYADGVLHVFDGTRPAVAGGTHTCTELVQMSPAGWGTPANGSAALAQEAQGVAGATGIATWARMYDATGLAAVDFNVASTGAECIIDQVQIEAGRTIRLQSLTLTMRNQ